MQDDSKVEHPSGDQETRSTADPVGKEGRGQGTEEGTGRENGDNGGFLGSRDVGVSLGVDVAGAEQPLPVGHGKNAADGSRVIARESKGLISLQPEEFETEAGAYPKRTPPKATKRPMAIAAHELPGSPLGFARAID